MRFPAATTRPPGLFTNPPQPRFTDRVVEALRVLHATAARAHVARSRLWTLDPGLFHDLRTVQESPRHSDVRTTIVSTHDLNKRGRAVPSPADSDAFVSE